MIHWNTTYCSSSGSLWYACILHVDTEMTRNKKQLIWLYKSLYTTIKYLNKSSGSPSKPCKSSIFQVTRNQEGEERFYRFHDNTLSYQYFHLKANPNKTQYIEMCGNEDLAHTGRTLTHQSWQPTTHSGKDIPTTISENQSFLKNTVETTKRILNLGH